MKITEQIELLQKGKELPVGTKKNWKGKDYIKTSEGWKEEGKGRKPKDKGVGEKMKGPQTSLNDILNQPGIDKDMKKKLIGLGKRGASKEQLDVAADGFKQGVDITGRGDFKGTSVEDLKEQVKNMAEGKKEVQEAGDKKKEEARAKKDPSKGERQGGGEPLKEGMEVRGSRGKFDGESGKILEGPNKDGYVYVDFPDMGDSDSVHIDELVTEEEFIEATDEEGLKDIKPNANKQTKPEDMEFKDSKGNTFTIEDKLTHHGQDVEVIGVNYQGPDSKGSIKVKGPTGQEYDVPTEELESTQEDKEETKKSFDDYVCDQLKK